MYRQILAELARVRGWVVHCYDAKNVADHRVALAATIVAAELLAGA
jgi:hypothetical protein